LLFATLATVVGACCAHFSSSDVEVLVGTLLLLFWRVRKIKYAAVPGAVVGTLFAWAIAPTRITREELLTSTAFFATLGAAVNCLCFRIWFDGVCGLVAVAAVYALMRLHAL
jgi:hypothetical protein